MNTAGGVLRTASIVWLALACLSGRFVFAADNAAPTAPYQLVVCLRFQDNPSLTPRLADAVSRQVRDQLANYLGGLATVEVHSREHELLTAIGARDLREPSLAIELLEGKRSDARFFLFSIDLQPRGYVIDHLQIDGRMRQMGAVHSRTTPDRQWIGKAICQAVTNGFSPVATIAPHPVDRDKVRLMFHGPREELPRAIRGGCVLLPLWVLRQRDGGNTWLPIPNTVLRMNAEQAQLLRQHDGVTAAFVQSNLSNPWNRTARVLGFQAIKLDTQTGRVRIRVVNEKTGSPAVNCIVSVNDTGFDFRDEHIVGQPDASGWIEPPRTYRDVAYIRVQQGVSEIKLPLPITGDVCEARLEIDVDKQSSEKSRLRRELNYLVQDVQTLSAVLNDTFRAVNEANEAKRYEEAFKLAEQAESLVRRQRQAADASLTKLRDAAAELKMESHPLLALCEQQLASTADRESSLSELLVNLKGTIEKQDAKNRAEAQLALAADAEKIGDIEEAIRGYRAALQLLPDDAGLKKQVADVEAAWEIKSPAHRAAREMIFGPWSAAEVTQVEALLPQLEAAFAELQKAGDYLTAMKLIRVNGQLIGDLSSLVEQLAENTSDAEQQEYNRYKAVVERLAEFQQRVVAFRTTATAAAAPARPATAPAGKPAASRQPKPPAAEVEEEEEAPRKAT